MSDRQHHRLTPFLLLLRHFKSSATIFWLSSWEAGNVGVELRGFVDNEHNQSLPFEPHVVLHRHQHHYDLRHGRILLVFLEISASMRGNVSLARVHRQENVQGAHFLVAIVPPVPALVAIVPPVPAIVAMAHPVVSTEALLHDVLLHPVVRNGTLLLDIRLLLIVLNR